MTMLRLMIILHQYSLKKIATNQISTITCNSFPDLQLLSDLVSSYANDLTLMLYQTSLDQGSVTENWKKALVTSIFKKEKDHYSLKLQARNFINLQTAGTHHLS